MPTDDEIISAYRTEYNSWIHRSNKETKQIEICRFDGDDITLIAFVKFSADDALEKADILFEQHRDAATAAAVRKLFEKPVKGIRKGKSATVVPLRRRKSNDDDAA